MIMKIAWVTDSTAYLDEELINHPDVYTIPMTILLDEKEYYDGIDFTPEEFYSQLKQVKTPPKTSQPSIGAFRKLYDQLAENYDQIMAILISGKLSGTVSSSQQASQLVSIPVTTIDSQILTYPLSFLLKKAIGWNAQGDNPSQIKQKLELLIPTNETYVLIGNLEQLNRSGRLTGLSFFIGSLLKIKPVIVLQAGELKIVGKVRNEKKAYDMLIDYLQAAYDRNGMKEVWILYGLDENAAASWKIRLSEQFPQIRFSCYPLGSAIGLHAGEHTIGLSWYNGI